MTESLVGPLNEALIDLVRLQRVPLFDLLELRSVLEAAVVSLTRAVQLDCQ